MAVAQPVSAQHMPPPFDPTQANPPSSYRRAQLKYNYEGNVRGYRDPFDGIRIQSIGELLWVLRTYGWKGGLTEDGVREYGKHARWFTSTWPPSNTAASPSTVKLKEANLRFADLHATMLQYVDLPGAYLVGANLEGANLSWANLVDSDLRATRLDGANMQDAQLVSASRERQLRAVVERNQNGSGAVEESAPDEKRPPYAGVTIGPRNDLLWVMRHAGWFTATSTPVDQPPVNLTGVDFRATSICDADMVGLDASDLKTIIDGLIELDRQTELEKAYQHNIGEHMPPYTDVGIRSTPELLWILLRRGWSGVPRVTGREPANLRQANLSTGSFRGVFLMKGDLGSANIGSANLIVAVLTGADLTGALLDRSTLTGADLRQTNMSGCTLQVASLVSASLQKADLPLANLCDANCTAANIRGANLDGAKVNADTHFDDILIDTHTRFGSMNWSIGVQLISIDWSQAPRLGEEDAIRSARERHDDATYLAAIRKAISAYLALSVALRAQGISVQAGDYHLRVEELHRKVLKLDRRWAPLFGSWLLDVVVGYGERPSRAIRLYLGVVIGFAAIYWGLSMWVGPHLLPPDLVVFSLTSFHGRGFFPNPQSDGIPLDNPMTWLASVEAVVGVVIEATFVAAFAHRFLTSS